MHLIMYRGTMSESIGNRAPHDAELPGNYGYVVKQHGVEDGPADGEQAKGRSVGEGYQGHDDRHLVHKPGDQEGDNGATQGGARRGPARGDEQPEEHNNG